MPAANRLCYSPEAVREESVVLSQMLLDLLVCPVCKAPVKLEPDGQALRCAACRLVYPIRDGFPVMIKEEARTET